jgi:glutathione S-transferase
MAGLKLFFDAFSQPSRAVWMLLEMTKTPFQPNLVNIAKGDNRSEEFLKISPNKTVPAIDDNGFYLFESAAIMKYCVDKYNLPDHWYPKDIQMRAKIDEYLSWHSSFFRLGSGVYLFLKYIRVKLMGIAPDEKRLNEAEHILERSIKLFEDYFLKDTKFINSDEISVADIQAACEFTQFWMVNNEAELFKDHPRIQRWLDDCHKTLNPTFDKVHRMLYKARDNGVFKSHL